LRYHFVNDRDETPERNNPMRLFAAVFTLALCVQSSSHAETIVVGDDMGGDLGLYEVRLGVYRSLGIKIRIDGACASACTILTQLPASQICATKRGRLLLHRIRPASGVAVDSSRIDDENVRLLSSYPEKIRTWIENHGGLTDRLLDMPPQALANAIGPCSTDAATVAVQTW
jgi:hypothetical protein